MFKLPFPVLLRAERYLLPTVLRFIIACLALFTLLWLMPETVVKLLGALTAGHLSLLQAGWILLLNIPTLLVSTLPMATLVGCTLLVRQKSQQNEWLALQALGLSRQRLLWFLARIGLVLGVALFAMQELMMPWVGPTLQQLNKQYHLRDQGSKGFVLPRYADACALNHGKPALQELIYFGKLSLYQATDVIYVRYEASPSTLTGGGASAYVKQLSISPKITWQRPRQGYPSTPVVLHQVNQANLLSDGTMVQQTHQPKQTLFWNNDTIELLSLAVRPSEWLPFWQLLRLEQLYQQFQLPLSTPQTQVAVHTRWQALPSMVLLAVLGGLLGRVAPRSNGLLPLISCAAVLFIYLVSKPLCVQLASLPWVNALLAASLPLCFLIVVAIWAYRRA